MSFASGVDFPSLSTHKLLLGKDAQGIEACAMHMGEVVAPKHMENWLECDVGPFYSGSIGRQKMCDPGFLCVTVWLS